MFGRFWEIALAVAVAANIMTGETSVESCSQEGECHQLPDGVCVAIVAQPQHAKELFVRVEAQKLVNDGHLDDWFTVNYSAEYVAEINKTANLDPQEHPPDRGWKERHQSVEHKEFNEDYEEQVQMAHYFAIDQCQQRYLALLDLDLMWRSQSNFSWIQAGLQLLRRNDGLVLVMPAFPGVELRNLKIRSRPWTRRIEKVHEMWSSTEATEAEDTTCDHPYTLPGWVSLLDLERYHALGPRQNVREHRCGGQLVKGKKCTSFEYIRGCGGMRHWQYALECVICNRPDLRQAHLTNWHLAWAQKAPIIRFRSEVSELVAGIQAIQNGSMNPAMGMDFVANWTTS